MNNYREKVGLSATEILPLVYEELRQMARFRMSSELPGQTLSATALVHEAFLRLTRANSLQVWNSERHFLAAAAVAMRRILIDTARRKKGIRNGGGMRRKSGVTVFDHRCDKNPSWIEQLSDLDTALSELSQVRPAAAEFVRLRLFDGLTAEETSQKMGITSRTGRRHWRFAKAWLHKKLQD